MITRSFPPCSPIRGPKPTGAAARGRWVVLVLALGAIGCAQQRPNLVIVSLDTLRADRLGAYGNTDGLSPNIDRFAGESWVFDQAFAQANETIYSHASLFTSRYPSELMALRGDFRIPDGTRTLAGALHGAGWETAGFVAGGHMAQEYGLSAGFTRWEDGASWGSLQETGAQAIHWLDTRKDEKPFFLLIHGYDTHERYLKPPPFGRSALPIDTPKSDGQSSENHADTLGEALGEQVGGASLVFDGHALSSVDAALWLSSERSRFDRGAGLAHWDPGATALQPKDVAHLAGLYDGAVVWMDAQFGLLMADLEERGVLDTAWVVVLSDHGEELGELGTFGHRAGLADTNLHVPLLIRPPGGGPGLRLDPLVGLIDVAPTLLDVLGQEGLLGAEGRSLLSLMDGVPDWETRPVFSEGALRLLSARGSGARLTCEGLSSDNPHTSSLIRSLPIDDRTLRLTGDGAEAESLRKALADWNEVLQTRRVGQP